MRAGGWRTGARFSLLDVKLGLRMLVKHPGLTLVGGLAMAFGIWVGAGTHEFIRQVVSPTLPLDGGDRVVGIILLDAERGVGTSERRVAHDFTEWRGGLETVQHLGAFHARERNLVTADGTGEPVKVAEITATGFEVARVAPLLGRGLIDSDERPGAPPVIVLGHSVWQERFGGDRSVVGQPVRIGSDRPTVVGVMPPGFAFPIEQNAWMPLRRSSLDHGRREGPRLFLFGRLRDGASLEEAQVELTVLGNRAAADSPETHEHLRPRVLPYAESIFYLPSVAALGLRSVNLFMVLLLVLICGNVALLMFARAATREGELLVRAALGASRTRIVAQLFVEALVLGLLAAALGMGAAGAGLRWMYSTAVAEITGTSLPFWFSPRLSRATVLYTVFLTLLAATVAGVLPALKVTGRGVQARLRQMGAGGGGLRFGGVWTGVIVVQVALTAVFPLAAVLVSQESREVEAMEVPFEEREYLAARLEMEREEGVASSASDSSFRAAARELEQRLESRPGIAAVTFGTRLPRMYHPHSLIEIDSGGAAPRPLQWPGYRVSSVSVTPDYFESLNAEVLKGRGFHSGDALDGVRTVVVNRSFVARVLGGRNPLGRRLRYLSRDDGEAQGDPEGEPWYEIVGVVSDLGLSWNASDPKVAGIYHPVPPGGTHPTHVAVHVRAHTGSTIHEMRRIAAAVDPRLRLHDVMRMDQLDDSELRFYSFWFWITILVSGVAITLSLAGLYAVMSFAVSRRTREIGVRVALGATRGRIVAAVFRKPLTQVGAGLLLGLVAAFVLAGLVEGASLTPRVILFLIGYMTAVTALLSLACVAPTRRALTVEPMVALREE